MINPTLESAFLNIPERFPSYNTFLYAEISPAPCCRIAAAISYQRTKMRACRLSGPVVRYPCGHLSLANVSLASRWLRLRLRRLLECVTW